MTQETLTPGSGNWTCPANVHEVLVEARGCGGNGGDYDSGFDAVGGGGGGGGYAASTLAVTPGNMYAWVVGGGGSATITEFGGSVYANYGSNGQTNAVGGTGNGGSTGDVTYNGGNGSGGSGNTEAGSGGGSAGTSGNGGDGSFAGFPPPVGGAGGAGGSDGGAGAYTGPAVSGSRGSGGGGGNIAFPTGGLGGDGEIVLTYESSASVPDAPSLTLASSYPDLTATVVDGDDGGAAIDGEKVELTAPSGSLVSTTGLVIYETITAGEWIDSNGVGPNLTIGGSEVAGIVADAISQDTANGAAPGISLSGSLTTAFWFEAAAANRGKDDTVAFLQLDDDVKGFILRLYSEADDTYTILQDGIALWNGTLADGWHHIASSRSAGIATAFHDGAAGTPTACPAQATSAATASMDCGNYAAKVAQPLWQSSAWTAAQISRFYNAGVGRLYSDRNVVAESFNRNEIQTINTAPLADNAGSFDLNGETISYLDASDTGDLEIQIEGALDVLFPGGYTLTRPDALWVIEFTGPNANTNIPEMVVDNLTGGGSLPTVGTVQDGNALSLTLTFSADANGVALAVGTEYTARAASHNSVGWSDWGATDSETLITVPDAPASQSLSADATTITVEITDGDDGGSAITKRYSYLSSPPGNLFPTALAAWALDGDFTDQSGNGRDATGSGFGFWVEGVDGTEEGARAADTFTVAANNALGTLQLGKTFACWFKSTGGSGIDSRFGIKTGDDSSECTLRIVNGDGEPNYLSIYDETLPGSTFQFITADDTDFFDGEWHHAAMVLEAGTATLYIDGTQAGDQATVVLRNFSAMTSPIAGQFMGDAGSIDEACIFPALTAAHVAQLYTRQLYAQRNVVAESATLSLTFSADPNGLLLAPGTTYGVQSSAENAVGEGAKCAEGTIALISTSAPTISAIAPVSFHSFTVTITPDDTDDPIADSWQVQVDGEVVKQGAFPQVLDVSGVASVGAASLELNGSTLIEWEDGVLTDPDGIVDAFAAEAGGLAADVSVTDNGNGTFTVRYVGSLADEPVSLPEITDFDGFAPDPSLTVTSVTVVVSEDENSDPLVPLETYDVVANAESAEDDPGWSEDSNELTVKLYGTELPSVSRPRRNRFLFLTR